MGFDNVFQIGQFKGKTYWDVLHRQPQFYVWAKKEGSRVPGIQQYVQWVEFFEFKGGEICLRMNLFNRPLHCPVAPRKELQRRHRLIRHCPTSVRTARSFHDSSHVFALWAFVHREKGRETPVQA